MVCEGWEGLTVDGRFPLLEWRGGWGDRCVFLTVGQATHKANIKLIQASGAAAESNLSRWEAAKAFPHPCLVQMMETGRYRIRDTDIAYVVTEKADSFLSGLIPQRTLSAEQMKEILGPVVDALEFLHENGFVHGSVKPSSIVLLNTEWKLSPDEMTRAGEPASLNRELDTYDPPEMGTGVLTPAADMWSLGMILVEACSQRTPVWDRNAAGDLGVPDWLPEPFREIARGCLRWDAGARISAKRAKELLAQMPPAASAVLSSEAKRSVSEASTVEERAAVSTLAERVAEVRAARDEEIRPRVAERQTVVSERVEAEPHELTPRSRLFANLDEEEERGSRKGPVLFGFLVVLVIGVVLGVRYRDRILPLIEKQNPPEVSQTTGQSGANPSQARAPSAGGQTPAPSQPQSTKQPSESGTSGSSAPQNPSGQLAAEVSQTPEQATAKNPAVSESQTASSQPQSKPEEIKPKQVQPKEEPSTPRVMNAKGAVAARVVPNVAPGARESMRRPVQVDVRVAVDESGRVMSAQCMTQSSGNYFARISQQAAHSWKFKPPISDGEARSSQWMLLFQFSRTRTDVIATELH
jgi:serine/threonine protein kinase